MLPCAFVWDPYVCKMLRITNDLSSEAAGPMLLKFYVEPPLGRGKTDCYNGCGPLTKMATIPIYGKNLLKSSPEPNKPPGTNLHTNHQGEEVYQNC